MSGIFISYRRQDSASFTRTLGKKLAERYGADSIFRDLEDIEAGDDFVDNGHDKQQKGEPARKGSEQSGSTVVSPEKNNEPVPEKTVPQQQKIKTVDRTSKEYYAGEKFIDISGNWRDRWGVMHYVEMTDNNHFIATSEGVVAEGVINGKQIEFVTSDGGFGKYRLSNMGNHISGTFCIRRY